VGPNRPLEQGLAALQVSRLDARLAWGNEGGVNVRTDRPCGRRVDPQPEAVSIAGDLARRYGADVIVLHVREHEMSWEGDIDVESHVEDRLLPLKQRVSESIVMELRNRTSLNPKKSRPDVSRMCPATDGKRLQEVGQRWSARLLVKGSVGLIRPAFETR
jgi:hypothetical protein